MKYLAFLLLLLSVVLQINLEAQSSIPVIPVTSGSEHKSETSITVDPNNNNHLFVGSNVSPTKVGYYYTNNAGENWVENDYFDNEGRTDPSVAYDLLGNVFYCFLKPDLEGLSDEIHIKKSSNNGVNWISNTKLSDHYSDKPYLAVDINPSSSYKNNIYVTWAINLQSIAFRKSGDNGSTFSNAININGNYNSIHSPIPTTGSNGEVYVAFAIGSETETGIGFNKSTDGGITFNGASQIASVAQIGTLSDDFYRLKSTKVRVNSWPTIDVDQNNGNIYIAWSDNANGNPDIFLIRSSDQGATWSSKVKVNTDNSDEDQWFPWLKVTSDGGINIVYYDSRNDPNNELTEVYLSRSTDGGVSFNDYKITNYNFTPKQVPSSNAFGYMGDYIGMAATDKTVYPCWMDDHLNSTFQLFTAKLDFNTNMTVDQLDENTPTDRIPLKVGRLLSDNTYDFESVPFTIPEDVGNEEILIGSSALYSNKKFHKWNVDNFYTLLETFSIDLGENNFISYFQNSVPNVVIRNYFSEYPSLNPVNDEIKFADPWLNDILAPHSNTLYINESKNPPPKNRPSPFYPDYGTVYGSDTTKGVFLNQPYTGNNPVYYSVQAISPQPINLGGSIGTRNFYFRNWGSTNVSFQNSNSVTTGVVFNSSNAVVNANFKGQGLSDNTNAYSSNNQRKFARTPDGILHNVYESLGHVWYETSTDNGITWEIMNGANPLDNGAGKSPSIAVGVGVVSIVFQQKSSNNHYTIQLNGFYKNNQQYVRNLNISLYTESIDNYTSDANPVIGWSGSKSIVAWKKSASYHYVSGTIGINSYQSTYTPIDDDVVLGTNNPNYLTLSYDGGFYYCAWEEDASNGNSDIFYKTIYFEYGTGGGGQAPGYWYTNQSAAQNISSGSGLNYNTHPSIVGLNNTSRIIWLGRYYLSMHPVVVFRASSNNSRFWNFGNGAS